MKSDILTSTLDPSIDAEEDGEVDSKCSEMNNRSLCSISLRV